MTNQSTIASKIVQQLAKYGDVHYVGGCVRDELLNISCDDIDIATNVPIDKIESLFETHDIGKNKDFGIVVVRVDDVNFEIAQYRSDGTYSDGRRPDDIKIVDNFHEDASRRDFTINALGKDVNGNIVDFFNGREDLEKGIIRTVGDPNIRFSEDYLRMIRAIRFATRFDFRIEKNTWQAIVDNSANITKISKERILKEILKMAEQGPILADSIMVMKDLGLLKHILPIIDCMSDYPHNYIHHPEGGVFDHVINALRISQSSNPIINLAILFHDVGKTMTYKFRDGWRHSYFGHDVKGADWIKNNLRNFLPLRKKDIDAIEFAAQSHMKFHKIVNIKPVKILRMMNNPYWNVLYHVAYADAFSAGQRKSTINLWNMVTNRIDVVSQARPINELRKLISGKRVMNVRGMKKGGPIIGKIIQSAIDAISNGQLDENDVDAFIKDWSE